MMEGKWSQTIISKFGKGDQSRVFFWLGVGGLRRIIVSEGLGHEEKHLGSPPKREKSQNMQIKTNLRGSSTTTTYPV